MKTAYAFPLLFLFAAACADVSTAPPVGLTPPASPSADLGDAPPPPADVAVAVCDVGCAVFDGTYFSNGSATAFAASAVTAATDGVCTVAGTAWLKFDKNQIEDEFASANARIKCSQLRATGTGTIQFGVVVVRLDQVLNFNNAPDCGVSATPCGTFTARAYVNGVEIAPAHGLIINRQFFNNNNCYVYPGEGGEPFFYCDSGLGGIT